MSLMSFDGSTTSSRWKRSQGQWHEGRTLKSARASYRRDLSHALQTDDRRAREFQVKLFESIEDTHCDSSSLSEQVQVNYIRLMVNDAVSAYVDSFVQDRKKPLSNTAIFDDRLRYVKFVKLVINKPLTGVGEKWIRCLSNKSIHAFLAEPRHVSMMAMVTLVLVVSYLTGAESVSSDTIFKAWRTNILDVCQRISASHRANRECPYIQLQHSENEAPPPTVEFIFNALIGSLVDVDPESTMIKYAMLLTVVAHAAIMSECHNLIDRSAYALMAMTSQLHKFKTSDLERVRRLCNRTCGTRSPKIVKLVEDVNLKMDTLRSKDSKTDCDPLLRASLQLAFELAQEPNASKYEDDIRSLLYSVKMLRSNPLSGDEECYKIRPITRQMPTISVLNEWARAIQDEWTVFLTTVCLECDHHQDNNNFFGAFQNWIEMDHRCAAAKVDVYAPAFAGKLLGGERTCLKLFHNTLIINARARSSFPSMFGLGLPMFDLVTRPNEPLDD